MYRWTKSFRFLHRRPFRSRHRGSDGACRIVRFCRCMAAASSGIVPHLQPRAKILVLRPGMRPRRRGSRPVSKHTAWAAHASRCSKRSADPASGCARSAPMRSSCPGIDPLNIVAIEIAADPDARIIPLSPGLPDDYLEHDGQIAKREIRAATISALAPRRGELLWDVGAGSGSIGVEWMLLILPTRQSRLKNAPIAPAHRPQCGFARRSRLGHRERKSASGFRRTSATRRDFHRRRRQRR